MHTHCKVLSIYSVALTVALIVSTSYSVINIRHLQRQWRERFGTDHEHYVDFFTDDAAATAADANVASEAGHRSASVHHMNHDANRRLARDVDGSDDTMRGRRRPVRKATVVSNRGGPAFVWGGKEEEDGSGADDNNNWVWLTSYSRIPVSHQ
jgi:hypothetical protein